MQTMQSSTPIPTSTPTLDTKNVKAEHERPSLDDTPLDGEDLDVLAKVIEPEPVPYTATGPATATAPSLLQDLATLDHLVVDRRLQVKTALTLRGKRNRYSVTAADGTVVYSVVEDSSWWTGYVLWGIRPMTLTFVDAKGLEVIRVRRPFSLTTRLVPCALQRMQSILVGSVYTAPLSRPYKSAVKVVGACTSLNSQIFSPPETCIGYVEQLWSAMRPLYVIKNKEEEVVFGVSGPKVTVHCCRDVRFKVARVQDGTVIATFTKRWQGMGHAVFMSSITGRFTVNLDLELSLEEKTLVLVTTILMDYMYYDV